MGEHHGGATVATGVARRAAGVEGQCGRAASKRDRFTEIDRQRDRLARFERAVVRAVGHAGHGRCCGVEHVALTSNWPAAAVSVADLDLDGIAARERGTVPTD